MADADLHGSVSVTEGWEEADRQGLPDGEQSPMQRASDILAAAREEAERILHEAELRAHEVLYATTEEATPEDAMRAVRELLVDVRRSVEASDEGRRQLRQEVEVIRSLLEACRDGIDELRGHAGVSPAVTPSAPSAEREERPAVDAAAAADTLDPRGGYVHLYIDNVETFGRLMDVHQALSASPDIREVAISRHQGRQSHILLNLERPLRAADIVRVLEAGGQRVVIQEVDAGLLTLRLSLVG